jgi:TorA maturation chaperone TorD
MNKDKAIRILESQIFLANLTDQTLNANQLTEVLTYLKTTKERLETEQTQLDTIERFKTQLNTKEILEDWDECFQGMLKTLKTK